MGTDKTSTACQQYPHDLSRLLNSTTVFWIFRLVLQPQSPHAGLRDLPCAGKIALGGFPLSFNGPIRQDHDPVHEPELSSRISA